MSKEMKLAFVVLGIVVFNVILMSPGFLGVKLIGGSALESAIGAAALAASLSILLFALHNFFFKTEGVVPLKELKSNEDYVSALNQYKHIKVLRDDLSLAIGQTEKLSKKKETLVERLNQQFEPTEMTYQKFISVILEVEKLFYVNIGNILNKISIFDEAEYKSVMNSDTSRFSKELIQEKREFYNEFKVFVQLALNINEEILLDLDKLLLEIIRLNNVDIDDIDNIESIKEIQALIKQTKYYK